MRTERGRACDFTASPGPTVAPFHTHMGLGFRVIGYGNIGIMEKKMETTTIVYWGNIGIMEKKMETTIIDPCIGLRCLRGKGVHAFFEPT